MTERTYQMMRLRGGDYLLPSNDARTLWRIYRYEEDGTAEVGDGHGEWRTLLGTFWACAKYEVPNWQSVSPERLNDDLETWENWAQWANTLPTRKAAIAEALR